jgi:indolepyruvate decarboxylase
VLDNHGYGTERYLHKGEWRFNEIQPWNYAALPAIYCGNGQSAQGRLVRTQAEFDAALEAAWDDANGAFLIQAKLEADDASQTLRKLAQRLGERLN